MSAFYAEFDAYLRGERERVAGVDDQHVGRLRVYRNGSIRSCTEVLRSNYPTVADLAGGARMTELAVGFVSARPPIEAHLTAYGRDFPAWLASLAEPAVPPLVPFARLDRGWTTAYFARDEAGFSPARAGRLAAEGILEDCVVRLAQHVALIDNDCAALDDWVALRDGGSPSGALVDRRQRVALWREQDEIRFREVELGEWMFLRAAQRGVPLIEAGEAAVAVDSEFDLGPFFAGILEAGLLCEAEQREA